MDIKLAKKAIKELDPSHDMDWMSLAYYDLENNWDESAPDIDTVKSKIAEYKLSDLREERNKLLVETDWVAGDDVPQALKDTWYSYRQELRDITETYTSLDDVVWPEKP